MGGRVTIGRISGQVLIDGHRRREKRAFGARLDDRRGEDESTGVVCRVWGKERDGFLARLRARVDETAF